MDLSSKHLRSYGIVTDRYGIDPLLDKVVPSIQNITTYTTYVVQQDERGSPDLISYRNYGSQDLWWHILVYNGIALYKDIVEGMVLRIPEYASIISVMTTSELSTRNVKIARA
jgi:hypothetical protein